MLLCYSTTKGKYYQVGEKRKMASDHHKYDNTIIETIPKKRIGKL